MRAWLLLATIVLATTVATAAETREASVAYTAGALTLCVDLPSWGIDEQASGECFGLEPGETHARLRVVDDVFPKVGVHYRVSTPDDLSAQSGVFCNELYLALAPGAYAVSVSVATPWAFDACGEAEAPVKGTIFASFS